MINKKIISIFLIIFFVICLMGNKFVYAESSTKEDIYDVILFWGQSNMVGTFNDWNERYDNTNSKEVENISKKTGIDKDILANATNFNYTKVEQTPGTVYEFIYDPENTQKKGQLREIKASTKVFGENLYYVPSEKKVISSTGTKDDYQSTSVSRGVNLVPEFCKTYYEKTGHKVVAVVTALGGQPIRAFEKIGQDGNVYTSTSNGQKRGYIYNTLKEKYTAAITYLNNNGYKVGNKIHVVLQGEADASSSAKEISNGKTIDSQVKKYKETFQNVHNLFKEELGIEKGVIIESSYTYSYNSSIGDNNVLKGVKSIHKAREQLVADNKDIIIGTSYLYDRFVPYDENVYKSSEYNNIWYVDESGKALAVEVARKNSLYNTCLNKTLDSKYYESHPDASENIIHFTSATLSYVGRQAAHTLTNNMISKIIVESNIKKDYIQNIETLDMKNKLSITYSDKTTRTLLFSDKYVKVTGFDNSKLGKQVVTVTYGDKKTTFEVNIVEKSLVSISIKEKPSKLMYLQYQENLNLNGGKLILTYSDNSTEELLMTDEKIKITGFDNSKLGKQEILISYKDKNTSFDVEIFQEDEWNVTENPKTGGSLLFIIIGIISLILVVVSYNENKKNINP